MISLLQEDAVQVPLIAAVEEVLEAEEVEVEVLLHTILHQLVDMPDIMTTLHLIPVIILKVPTMPHQVDIPPARVVLVTLLH